ncbi:DUF3099 domain-containing protein [Corynebacterium sp. UBA2622]|uniref:DUF3099 domain-containing protein n=1 Tax=Corynebacterium sp. UBA2622 TaxID=1946393 RepID=UPI0025C60D38|nr:DUF3099 domain-containing protein [Corynebacterium sp. UBA2622]
MSTAHNPGPRPDGDATTVDVDADAVPHKRRLGRRSTKALITDARRSPEQNIRSRERTYMVLQMLRFPFILLSIFSAWYLSNWWLASILFVISVPLPWIAVMIGNGQGEKRDVRSRNVYKPAAAREQQRLETARRREIGSGGPAAGNMPTIIDHDE